MRGCRFLEGYLSKSMKILNIALHFAEYATEISLAQTERHNVVLVLCRKNADDELLNKIDFYQQERLTVHTVDLYPMRRILSLFRSGVNLVRIAASMRPDVIHVQEATNEALYIFFLWLIFKRKKYYLTVHDPLSHSGDDSKLPIRKRLLIYALRRCAVGIAVHGRHLAELLRSSPKFRDKIIIPIHHPALRIQKRYNQDWIPGKILFAGRMQAYKGLGVFCEAMERLISKGVPAFPVVAGSGPELAIYRKRLESMKNAVVIDRFLMPSELDHLIQEAQIIALPYQDGSQSGIGAMALGHGRPVVVSNVGSLPEMMPHNIVGLVVNPNDSVNFSAAVELIISDEAMASFFGSNAYKRACTEFSPQTTMFQLDDFYNI